MLAVETVGQQLCGPRHGVIDDPMFVDPKPPGSATPPNVRLRPGSPAIDAGPGGSDIGALAYPNVYVVDASHAGASDTFYGYPGLPLRTISRAVELAGPGETIEVRAGVYRETIRPTVNDLTIRAAADAVVRINAAIVSPAGCATETPGGPPSPRGLPGSCGTASRPTDGGTTPTPPS